jgi:hypothetical protein
MDYLTTKSFKYLLVRKGGYKHKDNFTKLINNLLSRKNGVNTFLKAMKRQSAELRCYLYILCTTGILKSLLS